MSLTNKVAGGAVLMVVLRLLDRSIGVVSTIILARLLVPADFGLVAMAMSIVALAELTSAFNFDLALLQDPNAGRKEYDTVWTLNMMLGFAASIILLCLAWPASLYYGEPSLFSAIAALSIVSFVGGMENVGIVAFRKELRFGQDFLFLLSRRLLGFVLTVALAVITRSYWALVIGTIGARLGTTAISYAIHPYRPRFCLAAASAVLRFSGWLLVNNFLYFIIHRSADFLVGRTLGARALGLHTIAYEVANLPTTQMIAPINRAIYPGYTMVGGSKESLTAAFARVFGLIALIGFPAGVGLAAVSGPLVSVFLGPNWVAAGPLIEIMAFAGAISALQTNIGYVYAAYGRPKDQTVMTVLYTAMLVPALFLGAKYWGLTGVACAFLVVAVIHTPLNFAFLMRVLEIKGTVILHAVWRPVVASIAMYTAVSKYIAFAGETLPGREYVALFSAVALGTIVYTVVVLGLWKLRGSNGGAEGEAIRLVRSAALERWARLKAR